MSKDQFRDLLAEFLKDGMTRDHIVILFVFCSDVIVSLLRKRVKGCVELCWKFAQWSADFIVEKVTTWVTNNGGWVSTVDSVLNVMKCSYLVDIQHTFLSWFNKKKRRKKKFRSLI